MKQADRIRQFVLDHFITTARTAGRSEVTVRAGDVHRAMSLKNGMPAVCSAIGSNLFESIARVTRLEQTGPANGANAIFHYALGAASSRRQLAPAKAAKVQAPIADIAGDLDLQDALVLVSCVKSKLPHPDSARTLYTSAWFRKVRDIVEASGARWYVLSALYGLVGPDENIAPYNHTLNTLGVADRRVWADKVLHKLLPEVKRHRRVVMFAGQRYREFLVEPLLRLGLKVEVPTAHLRRGEQLAWLTDHG